MLETCISCKNSVKSGHRTKAEEWAERQSYNQSYLSPCWEELFRPDTVTINHLIYTYMYLFCESIGETGLIFCIFSSQEKTMGLSTAQSTSSAGHVMESSYVTIS